MSDTFEFDTELGSLTIGRYAGSSEDRSGKRTRYVFTDCYGRVAKDLTRSDLAKLASWIVEELAHPHPET